MACTHVWQGDADGVVCQKCGEQLTAEEYAKLINGEPKKTKADAKTAKK